MSDVTNKLTRLLTASEFDRSQLALDLGVPERTVYRWEIGEVEIPRKHWSRLAERFGVSVPYLLGLEHDNDGNGEEAVA